MSVKALPQVDPYTRLDKLLKAVAGRTPSPAELDAISEATSAAKALSPQLQSLQIAEASFREASPERRATMLRDAHERAEITRSAFEASTRNPDLYATAAVAPEKALPEPVRLLEKFEGFRLVGGDGIRIIGQMGDDTGSIGFRPAQDFVELIHHGAVYPVTREELPPKLQPLYDAYHASPVINGFLSLMQRELKWQVKG